MLLPVRSMLPRTARTMSSAAQPGLRDFLQNAPGGGCGLSQPAASVEPSAGTNGRSVFVETYGCQMNSADSEVVRSVMLASGYGMAPAAEDADIVLLNTCAIRENAERKIWSRLGHLRGMRRARKQNLTVGVLGCMAERLKRKILESGEGVDLIAGDTAMHVTTH